MVSAQPGTPLARKQPKSSLWRKSLGWVCIALGLAGLLLPLLPGIPLLLFGMALLSTQYRWARAALAWMKSKFHRKHSVRT